MPVTKRTRYEVLKRDNHTCRYCGGSAPDVTLTVDHVLPVALGGSDKPDNLVAACQDCNAGKASTSPDAAVVEDVRADDLRWAAALARVAKARARQRKKRDRYVVTFADEWDRWGWGPSGENRFPVPANWEASIERFYELGVPVDDIRDCVRIACGNDRIAVDERFRYFAGCVWRVVDQMHDAAREIVGGE
jgi:hypothetical protein